MTASPSDLPERFQPPAGWRFQSFTNAAGKVLRYGTVQPAAPAGQVVALEGLSEFGEKYFEFAHDCLARNLGFWVMDWRGQGLSDRFLANGHKRHAVPFDDDLRDLHDFITHQVRPASGAQKLIMFGHSMGGNLGLRYLEAQPDVFSGAAFTAPMAGLSAARAIAPWLRLPLARFFNRLFGERYLRGGSDYQDLRGNPRRNVFSHDPARNGLQHAWYVINPALGVGSVTYRWIYEALVSCLRINKTGVPERIACPVLIALAGDEHLVDNDAMRLLAARIPQAIMIELPESFHEILMERDAVRDRFMAAFDALLAQALNLSGPATPAQ